MRFLTKTLPMSSFNRSSWSHSMLMCYAVKVAMQVFDTNIQQPLPNQSALNAIHDLRFD